MLLLNGIGFIYLFVPIGHGHPSLSRVEVCDCANACVCVCVSDSTLYVCAFGRGSVKSHSGACEDKQSQREENDTNQLKHYCPLYSRLIRSSQGTGGLYRHKHPDTRPYNCYERGLDAAIRTALAPSKQFGLRITIFQEKKGQSDTQTAR